MTTGEILALLHRQFPVGDLRNRYGVGNSARSDLDDLARDLLTDRIVAIRQVELAEDVVEGQFENVPLLQPRETTRDMFFK